MAVWNHDERTALMILHEAYCNLASAERQDIFGRIFEGRLNNPNKPRRYSPQALVDQWRQCGANERQTKMWQDIDTANPDSAQQVRLANMRQAIQHHAARNDGVNFLTGQANQRINLGAHTPYIPGGGQEDESEDGEDGGSEGGEQEENGGDAMDAQGEENGQVEAVQADQQEVQQVNQQLVAQSPLPGPFGTMPLWGGPGTCEECEEPLEARSLEQPVRRMSSVLWHCNV